MTTKKLPPVYQTDDYHECLQNGHKFCLVAAKLNSSGSSFWKELEVEGDLTYKLDRSHIHRGLCLRPDQNSNQNIIKQATSLLNSQLYSHNLSSNINDIHCVIEGSSQSPIDIVLPFFVLTVFCCVFIGTLLDTKNRKLKTTLEKVLVKFSIKENWKKLTNTDGNEDFNRLKSIQGIRALTNIGVVCLHASIILTMTFYHNPEQLELVFTSTLLRVSSSITMLLVHIFLVISAFLFTNQVYSYHEKKGSFTFRDFFVLVINRYFRLYVTTFLFVIFSQSSLLIPYLGVPSMRLFNMNRNGCENNWIWTMLFANNVLTVEDSCYTTAWYLAADFQSYVLLIGVIYIILKYKLNSMKVMLIALVSAVIFYGMILYATDMNSVIMGYTFKDFQNSRIKDSLKYRVLYTLPFAIIPTSITGMLFGYLYFRSKKFETKSIKPVYRTIWSILFFGLPAVSLGLSIFTYNRILTAIIGSLLKVVYTTGFAVGILGMSFGLGGRLRTFFEGKYNIFLGNISYSVYIINFTLMMLSSAGKSEVYTLDVTHVIFVIIKEICVNVFAGLLLALFIEQPALSIQKMILPQLRTNNVETEKKK